jgi:type II secretory pathway pseudopilin PulG
VSQRRGLTLAEALVTFLLLSLALLIVAGLAREYSDFLRFGSKLDRGLGAAQVAVARIRTELGEATSVLTPSTGTASELLFERVDPAAPRLPEPPYPAPLTFDPNSAGTRIRVRYHLQGDILQREAPSSSGDNVVIARSVASFAAELLSSGNYQVTLGIDSGKTVTPLRIEVFLPIEVSP